MNVEDISQILKDHISKARSTNTHTAKLMLLSDLFQRLFGISLEKILTGVETRLKSELCGIRGSADLIFTNVIFEVKVDLSKELEDAKQQLKKYLQVLHEKEPGKKSIGIATDVIEFRAYRPVIKQGKVIDLEEIGSINIAKKPPQEVVLWLDSFIFSQSKIKPTAKDLKSRFGPGSPTHSIAIDELRSLWSQVENERDVRLKLDLWTRNMEIVYGSAPELDSFLDHTYLVNLVKLITYLKLSGNSVIKEDDIKEALTGEYFSSYGIANLIEEDFFSWIMHPKIANAALRLMYQIAKELLRYDFSQIDEDFFKEIYEEIVERGERHRIGEYYTPEWLVQLVLEEVVSTWRKENKGFPRILDPACGSGTFLYNAIHMAKKILKDEGKTPDEILGFIVNNIVGVDINPVAVIIARANYLLALGDLLKQGRRITIPIYVADSIKLPTALNTFTNGGTIPVYKIDTDNHSIQIPKSIITKSDVLSTVLSSMKNAANVYKTRKNKNEAIEVFKRETLAYLSQGEFEVLKRSLETIMSLMDKGLDSIWIYILSNVYAPITLMESKFDIVVGNPPWIAMRYVENERYQEFLKQQALNYELLDSSQVNLFTQMEMATLFFCKSGDLYLKDHGIIAFVMPRSVLTGALHHTNFKRFNKPKMKLIKIIDLENVSPLFNVPSCVLIAIKGEETTYPVPARRYKGKLSEKNIKLAEAIKVLSVEDYMYEPPQIPRKYSYYHELIRAGAALYPRCFYFIDFDAHPLLGINVEKPAVKTSEEIEEKEPWKGIKLEGVVESDFVYLTVLGGDIVPFGYIKLRPVVLPIELTDTGYKLLDVDELQAKGYVHMAQWLENIQSIWQKRSTEKARKSYPRVIDYINYQGLLTIQNPKKRYVVVYNSSGTNLVSCVIDKLALPSLRVYEAMIKPRGFVADKKTHFYETDSELEAHYVCAVLNSNVVNEKIKHLQTRGLFGERDVGRRPFMLPIPKFDENNQLHQKLAELSKKCHTKVTTLQLQGMSTAKARKEVKNAIKNELAEIDKLVSQLLEF